MAPSALWLGVFPVIQVIVCGATAIGNPMDCFLTADDTIRDVFVNGTRVEVQDNREFNGTYGVGKQFRFSLPSLQFRIGIHAENGLTFSLPPSQVPSQAPTYPSSSPTAFPTQAPHPLSCSNKVGL
ncbi:hypothetical protein AAMO2058_001320300 [Amorphochlora amoebiformis]